MARTDPQRSGVPVLDFETLRLTGRPNACLVAPPGLCAAAAPHPAAPVYAVPASRLRDALLQVISRQPRVALRGLDEAAMAYEFEQYSPVLRFADRISLRVMPHGPEAATLAIYSRARTGYYDFGVNRKRVAAWLEELAGELAGLDGARAS